MPENKSSEPADHPIEPGDFVALSAEVTSPTDSGAEVESLSANLSPVGPPTILIGAEHTPALESQLTGLSVGDTGKIEFAPDGTGESVTPITEVTNEAISDALANVGIETAWELLTADLDQLEETLFMKKEHTRALQAETREYLGDRVLLEFTVVKHYRWTEGPPPHNKGDTHNQEGNEDDISFNDTNYLEELQIKRVHDDETVLVESSPGNYTPIVAVSNSYLERSTVEQDSHGTSIEINGVSHTIYTAVVEENLRGDTTTVHPVVIDSYSLDFT